MDAATNNGGKRNYPLDFIGEHIAHVFLNTIHATDCKNCHGRAAADPIKGVTQSRRHDRSPARRRYTLVPGGCSLLNRSPIVTRTPPSQKNIPPQILDAPPDGAQLCRKELSLRK